MEEVTRSRLSASEAEKGVHTPPNGTTDGTHLSNIHDGAPPAMDGGMNAWLFLAACFAMEALVWGFAFTYGVFQAYYSDIPQFKDSGNIAVVGTCAMVILYVLMAPHQYQLTYPGNHVSRHPPRLRRLQTMA